MQGVAASYLPVNLVGIVTLKLLGIQMLLMLWKAMQGYASII